MVITNEATQESATYVASAAKTAQAVAEVYVVGVGSAVNNSELAVYAGSLNRVTNIGFSDLNDTQSCPDQLRQSDNCFHNDQSANLCHKQYSEKPIIDQFPDYKSNLASFNH